MSGAVAVRAVRGAELAAWAGVLVTALGLYVAGGTASGSTAFGITQWSHLASSGLVAPTAAGLAIAALLVGVTGSWRTGRRLPDAAWPFIIAGAAYATFFVLQTHFLNQDGRMYAWRFRDIPATNGAFVTHDELLELYVHSRFWYYTHLWWNWDVPRSYRPLSCGAGAVFVWLLLRYAQRQGRQAAPVLVAGMLAGAYMQLFFGEVENYTLTAALALLYFLAADRFLTRDARLWEPSAALAVAMCFHLLTGWMLPSLLFLFHVEWRRTGSRAVLVRSAAPFFAIGGSVLAYFHFHGLPVTYFISSHAGSAARNANVWVWNDPEMSWHYYVEQLNLIYLLCPAVLMMLPLAAWKRVPGDDATRFLAIAASMLLLIQALWRAQLGVYMDWNLFATGGMALALFVWRIIAVAANARPARAIAYALVATYALHTYSWITFNHTLLMPNG